MNKIKRKWLFYGSAALVAIALAWFIPPVWQLSQGSVNVTQWHRDKGEVQVEVGPEQSTWIDAKKISKNVLNAFVVAEDSRFYQHFGLDVEEIEASLKLNLRKGRYVRGASTITQQVVKMACLSRSKSLIRKSREAVGAVILEQISTKNQILEWYINLAEFGDGVYGIKQAAWHYFNTKPELLTIQQAAHLALVLPSPNGWSVGLRRRDLTEFGHKRFATIVNRMKMGGYITEEQWLNALATGNFGRPVNSYYEILAKHQRNEGLGSEDLEMTEEGIPLGVPFVESIDSPDRAQSRQESHGQTVLDELIIDDREIEPIPTPQAQGETGSPSDEDANLDQPYDESNPHDSSEETIDELDPDDQSATEN